MEIVWDEPKRLENLRKHGLDSADLDMLFFECTVVISSRQGCFVAIGEFDGRIIVAVVLRPLGSEAVSIVSMRPASRKERRLR